MADVALIPGHHPDAQGATLDLEGEVVTEYELWTPFARELALTLDAEGVTPAVIERPSPKPDKALTDRINRTGADAAIEMHFNAVADQDVRGTLMLHYPESQGGKRLAGLLQDKTLDVLGLRNRGTREEAGFPMLRDTEMPAVIAEPAFASNYRDGFRLLSRLPDLMMAYRDAILAFLRA